MCMHVCVRVRVRVRVRVCVWVACDAPLALRRASTCPARRLARAACANDELACRAPACS